MVRFIFACLESIVSLWPHTYPWKVSYVQNHREVSLTRSLLSQAVHMHQELSQATPKRPSSTIMGLPQGQIERLFWQIYNSTQSKNQSR